MTPALARPLSFLDFLTTIPEDRKRYELVNGERVQLIATRAHDDGADFIYDAFRDEVRRDPLNYKVSRFASVRTRRDDGLVQGRKPDVRVVDTSRRANLSMLSYARFLDRGHLGQLKTKTV